MQSASVSHGVVRKAIDLPDVQDAGIQLPKDRASAFGAKIKCQKIHATPSLC